MVSKNVGDEVANTTTMKEKVINKGENIMSTITNETQTKVKHLLDSVLRPRRMSQSRSAGAAQEAAKYWWNHWAIYLGAISLAAFAHLFSWVALFNKDREYMIAYSFLLTPMLAFVLIPLTDIVVHLLQPEKPFWWLYKPSSESSTRITSEEEVQESYAQQNRVGAPKSNVQYGTGVQNTLNYTPLAYSYCIYFYAAFHTFSWCYSLYQVKHMHLSPLNFLFWTHCFSLGIVLFSSVSVAHELIHKLNWLDLFVGKVILALFGYTHFAIEHIHGHHKHVASDLDPATAKFGENVYSFFLRTVKGQFMHSWQIEIDRLKKKNISVYNIRHNRMIRYTAMTVGLPFAIWYFVNVNAMITNLIASFIAIFFLESINYVEHYGLERLKLPSNGSSSSNARYEPIRAEHSWDCAMRPSSYVMLNINLHSDHHANPLKRYETLELSLGASPMLPFDYPTMALLSMIPPLYRKITHPILEEFHRTKLRQEMKQPKSFDMRTPPHSAS